MKIVKGSITVEASLVMPMVICVCVAFIYLIKAIQFQQDLYYAMSETADIISAFSVPYEEFVVNGKKKIKSEKTMSGNIDESKYTSYIKKIGKSAFVKASIKEIMDEKAENPSLLGGLTAVTFISSDIEEEDPDIVLVARYAIHIPFVSVFTGNKVQAVRLCTRAFVGDDNLSSQQDDYEEIVYVTNTGKVYHTDRDCSYIKVKTEKVAVADIPKKRNESGAKYYACEMCIKGNAKNEFYYICSYGRRYHISLSCSELKRTVKTKKLSELGEMRKCAKCPDR